MYLNTHSIVLKHNGEEKEFNLRLTISSQLKLKKAFKEEGVQLIFSAMDDLELMLKLLTEALTFTGNENQVTDGEQFYELLVDNGYSGKEDFAKLVFDIAAASGIIKEGQSEKVSKMISDKYDEMFDFLSNGSVEEAEENSDDDSSFRS